MSYGLVLVVLVYSVRFFVLCSAAAACSKLCDENSSQTNNDNRDGRETSLTQQPVNIERRAMILRRRAVQVVQRYLFVISARTLKLRSAAAGPTRLPHAVDSIDAGLSANKNQSAGGNENSAVCRSVLECVVPYKQTR